MDVLILLENALHAGLALSIEGDRLIIRGPSRAEELARQLLERKPEVIAALSQRSGSDVSADAGDQPDVERCPSCRQRDFQRPCAGGAWRCARCRPYDLPGTELEWWPRVTMTVPFDASALLANGSCACHCCGGTTQWRLRSGGPWVCSRCHPPLPPPEAIETVTIGEIAP